MSSADHGPVDDTIISEQRDYYEARAPEYDEWFYRRGRYDRGVEETNRWFAEVEDVRAALAAVNWAGRHVLELAPGTGVWSEWLLDQGAKLSVVDGSSAMLQMLKAKLGNRTRDVEFQHADLFEWRPTREYDGVFFGFFLSHVPRHRLGEFFSTVASALSSNAPFGFIDSRREHTSTAADHVLPGDDDEVMTRRLNDGREYRIVKNFFEPDELFVPTSSAGLSLVASVTPTYFLFGTGVKR